MFPALDESEALDAAPMAAFGDHKIHEVLATCAEFRPSVDIFVE